MDDDTFEPLPAHDVVSARCLIQEAQNIADDHVLRPDDRLVKIARRLEAAQRLLAMRLRDD